MNRHSFAAAAVAVVAGVGAGAGAACSSSSSTPAADADGGGGSGGAGSDPGKVTCATLTCNAGPPGNFPTAPGMAYCCEGGDAGPSCEVVGMGASPLCTAGATPLFCDEPYDCSDTGKRACCFGFSSSRSGLAVCAGAACGVDDLELCKNDSQCPDTGHCAQVTCKNGSQWMACNTSSECK